MRWIPGNSPSLLAPWMYRRGERVRIGGTIGTGVDRMIETAPADRGEAAEPG
jgi:hypothetical protein